MLTIRNTQLQRLGQSQRAQFVDAMLVHLYNYFPGVAWLLTPAELRAKVHVTIDRAALYQLTSQQQVCRFINLAATYGWEFDRDPELSWMRSTLIESSLSKAGERLDRLIQICLHRQRIEKQNSVVHQALSSVSRNAPTIPAATQEEDYLGHKIFLNTQPAMPITDELIARNPLSYHLSQGLWFSYETTRVVSRPPPAVHARSNERDVLFRRKTGAHLVR
jgi:hypothetical protein